MMNQIKIWEQWFLVAGKNGVFDSKSLSFLCG